MFERDGEEILYYWITDPEDPVFKNFPNDMNSAVRKVVDKVVEN